MLRVLKFLCVFSFVVVVPFWTILVVVRLYISSRDSNDLQTDDMYWLYGASLIMQKMLLHEKTRASGAGDKVELW